MRAELLTRVREFFATRGFIEVTTPLLSDEAIPELHIEPPQLAEGRCGTTPQWLMASPEMDMKRLLCGGATAIYQITRSFRGGERGRLHRPEFTIVEWYRVGDDAETGMKLLDAFLQEAAGAPPAQRKSYREVFLEALSIDPHQAELEELAGSARRRGHALPEAAAGDRDEWLNLLLATQIEDQLGYAAPVLVYDFPASQSALARIEADEQGVAVARRFELYWRGVELANGYDELTNAAELRTRLTDVNRQRVADGRTPLPLPERLLSAMTDPGLPASSGCALGFDRLLMLTADADSIDEVS